MRVKKYNEEILEILKEQNIHIVNNSIYSINYVGLVVSILSNGKPLDKSLKIVYRDVHEITTGQLDNTLAYLNEEDKNQILMEDIHEEKVLSGYFSSTLKEQVSVLSGSMNSKNVFMLSCKNEYTLNRLITLSASLLPRMIKGMIDEKEIEKHKDLLKSIISADNDKLDSIICDASVIDWGDLRSQCEKKVIMNCIRAANKKRIESSEQKISSWKSRNKALMDEYAQIIRNINNELILLSGALSVNDDNENNQSMIDFITCNQSIHDLRMSSNKLVYDVIADICYFDSDEYKIATEKEECAIYSGVDRRDIADCKWLLDEIFIRKKYSIRGSASYSIEFDSLAIMANASNKSILEDKYPEVEPAPHAAVHKCNGGFAQMWNEAINRGDLINAIQATISLTQNINWMDSYVASGFLTDILSHKHIMDKQGVLYSGDEIIAKRRDE